MRKKEYIMPIDDSALDYDEMFIGVIRKQKELIRCKDCKFYKRYAHADWSVMLCDRIKTTMADGLKANDYCSRAERKEPTCNDCFYSMQNCNDLSICCEDETGLCDGFVSMVERKEE